eukprot:COSAG02_NODE_65180_length_258_cov_1.301887_1_plen_35_part_10
MFMPAAILCLGNLVSVIVVSVAAAEQDSAVLTSMP